MRFSVIKEYLFRVSLGLSITLGALVGGRRFEPFCAILYGWHKKGFSLPRRIVDWVAYHVFNDKDHCLHSRIVFFFVDAGRKTYTRNRIQHRKDRKKN